MLLRVICVLDFKSLEAVSSYINDRFAAIKDEKAPLPSRTDFITLSKLLSFTL